MPEINEEIRQDNERQLAAFAAHGAMLDAFDARQFTLDECVWIAAAFKPVMRKYLEVGAVPVKGFMDTVFRALATLEDSVLFPAEDPEIALQEDQDSCNHPAYKYVKVGKTVEETCVTPDCGHVRAIGI